MASHAGPVTKRVEAEDLQTDMTMTSKSTPTNQTYGPELATSIHSLPQELMAIIFSKLNCQDRVSAACVCSHWRVLIDMPSVWEDFCPKLNVDKLTPEHIEKIRIRMIRTVNIVAGSNMEKMKTFLEELPCLVNLSLFLSHSFNGLYPGNNTLPSIQSFTIVTSLLDAEVLRSSLQPMVNLQDLILGSTSDQNSFVVLKGLRCLTTLCIGCNRNVVEVAGTSIGDLKLIPSMKYLALHNVTMGDSGLDFISRAFPKLDTLGLTLAPLVTSDGLKKLTNLKELRILNIIAGHFEHGWMEDFQTQLPKLDYLSLCGCRGISNECLQSISKMSALRVLHVPIEGQELEVLPVLGKGCPGLQTLSLAHGNLNINQGLHIATWMPSLQGLILMDCSVSDDFGWVHCKSFNKLKMLSFIYCRLPLEQCLIYLSEMASLEELSLIHCTITANESIKLLRENRRFEALTSLVLKKIEMNDESLIELSKTTPFLTKLTIVSCNNVTENGLATAVSNLPQLKALTSNISAETKRGLDSILPHLHFYHE